MDPNAVENVLYLCDSYKITHHAQYPPDRTHVYSYFESRGGKFESTCFFGLQYLIKRWLVGPVVNKEMIQEAKNFFMSHLRQDVFNEDGWNHIVEKHGGYLPLRIKAVPEGTVVPYKNVLFTVENTDPAVPWLTNWFETLLVQVWYPMTVCTNSRMQKLLIAKYMSETADSLAGLPFKLHDFGYRGSTSVESAAIGDAGHLVNFMSTDTIAGLQLCKKYYHCPMAAFSAPADEHSTVTTWGPSGETEAFRTLLKRFPSGLVCVVVDSYDVFHAVKNIMGVELYDLVLERENKGCVVVRPDSGEPKEIVVKVLQMLSERFEVTTNSKGYKVLPPYLRILQGDGISYKTIDEILAAMKDDGWSAENVNFGSGGGLLQKLDRDTQKCAFKCSHVTVNGEERHVFKDPVTDRGKKSKKGRLTLELNDGQYVTVTEGKGDLKKDEMIVIFENGRLLKDWTLDEIRERAEIDLVKEANKQNSL